MNRLGRNLIAVTVASVLILGVPFPGPAAERKTELSVTYDAPRLSVEATGVSLQRVLGEIGEKLGFVVVDYGGSDRLLTFSIQDASAEEVLGQLLRGENYAVVYDGQRKEIAKVLLLTSSVQASTENQQTEKGHERIVQSQVGLTYHSPVSPPSLFGEQKRPDKAKAEVKVEDIMRAHALSGLIDPIGMLSGTADVPQPFGSPTGSSFSTGAMSTSPPRQDIHETLAVTTRLAQQNLKALVDGLATASSSLFQSLPNTGR
jgi:hypothetical protein